MTSRLSEERASTCQHLDEKGYKTSHFFSWQIWTTFVRCELFPHLKMQMEIISYQNNARMSSKRIPRSNYTVFIYEITKKLNKNRTDPWPLSNLTLFPQLTQQTQSTVFPETSTVTLKPALAFKPSPTVHFIYLWFYFRSLTLTVHFIYTWFFPLWNLILLCSPGWS